ncbi:MAG: hypothetical protein ACSW8B_03320 [bacterium]
MKSWVKTLMADVTIAATAVAVYSPGFIGLRPTDPNILKSALSITIGMALVYAFVHANFLRDKEVEEASKQEIHSFQTAKSVFKSLEEGRIFKEVIADAKEQITRAESDYQMLERTFDERFVAGSLTYEKFMGVADACIEAMVKNFDSLAMRIRMFDEKGYRHIKYLVETGNYQHDTIPDRLQEEKYEAYMKNYDEIKNILNLNEMMLVKLERLAIEVTSLTSQEINDESAILAEELEQLTAETKYYQ